MAWSGRLVSTVLAVVAAMLSAAAATATATQPSTRTVAVTPSRELRVKGQLTELAVDQGRAATIAGPVVLTWSPLTGRSSSRRIGCDNFVYGVVLAGARDATICHDELMDASSNFVSGNGVPRLSEEVCWIDDNGYSEGDCTRADLRLAGAGSLLVASGPATFAGPLSIVGSQRYGLLRLDARRVVLLRVFRRNPHLFNVDESRVLLKPAPGVLEIVSASGRLAASFNLPVSGAVLRHDRLFTLKGTEVAVRDLRGNALRQLRVPPRSELQDARGDFVVYQASDHQLHLLRVSDGHDVGLHLVGQAGPVWGRLDPAGLFYAYTLKGSKSSTLGFVAADRLSGLFTH